MRAPFNTTATFLDGPGTATPGLPRIISAPARLVPDPYFIDGSIPLSDAVKYLTSDTPLPFASKNTLLSADRWEFNFNHSDRVVIASESAFTYLVQRVELCTWPAFPNLYYRSTLKLTTPTPTACQLNYKATYTMVRIMGPLPGPVVRTNPTTWIATNLLMIAEWTAIDPMTCISGWIIIFGGHTYTANYSGVGVTTFIRDDGPGVDDIVVIGI